MKRKDLSVILQDLPLKLENRGQCLILILLCMVPPLSNADDYRFDPAPTYSQGMGEFQTEEDYVEPKDPSVCKLYLQNLLYFAQKNVPMSCERPVAPKFSARIKKVRWDDIDPEKNTVLLQNLITKSQPSLEMTASNIGRTSNIVKKQRLIFRLAKLRLSGYVTNDDDNVRPSEPIAFQIVEFGENSEKSNPLELHRCIDKRGSPDQKDVPRGDDLYLVAEDGRKVYKNLHSIIPAGGWGRQYLLVINGQPYVERINYKGDIQLQEIDRDYPVIAKPVCLYNFKLNSAK